MQKKISVVIPTYRRPYLLGKCIEALTMQQFELNDYEIIIVSDGPDQQTHDLLNNLEHLIHPFIQYISLVHNSGPAAARNAGWHSANGRLIAFTDDDTRPDKYWLASLWKNYQEMKEPEYVAFSGKVIVPLPEEPTDFELNTAHLETAAFVTANCACTKAALEALDGFDERFTTAWREDSDLEFRLMEKNINIDKIEDAVVVHPARKAKWGISIKEQKKTMFNALLYKKFPLLFRKKIQQGPAWNYYVTISGILILIAGLIFRSGILAITGASVYLLFTVQFIFKRLTATSRSARHVSEMVLTSMVIPFISVYWTIYGAIKYKVIFY
ncbi:MAG: glycosyltransferase [Chitinophagaceae bacterium]|nr:glycosyltransferase [Chitinophagaceae bacterium]